MSSPSEANRFRVLVEQSLDASALIQPDGRVAYVSPGITNILGYRPEEFVALAPFQIIHPDDQDAARRSFNDLLSQPEGSQTVVNRVQHKDGSWCWIETISTNQLETPGIAAIISNFRDITEQRRAAAVIREADEKFRFIVDSATEFAIFTTDLDGRVDSWNSGARRLLGYSEEEILGKDCRIFFTPEDNTTAQPEAEMRDAITRGKGDDQKWHVRKDGSRFWGSGLMMPLRDDSDRIRGYLKIFRDMTREKQAEERLREADRRKDEFLAILAHELRNPLAAISNAAQLLSLPGDMQSREWIHEVISRQARHLGHLLDDLLDVSRITQGKIQLRQERLNIAVVIGKAIEAVRPALEAKKHRMTVDISPGEMTVVGDATRIEQVVVNLLGNAIKYTDDGGHITVTASPVTLAGNLGHEVVITIKDTGIGIAPEMLARIFEPFAQADRSLDRSQGGLGIGLTLVRKLVEMHGGKVAATSGGIGKGSIFQISLPRATGSVADESSHVSEPSQAPEGYRVLIVDDNRDVATSLGAFLSHSGYEIETAFDGHSVVELARATKPNALILDIGLPGINGYEIAKQLRVSSEFRDAVLIAISGYGQEEDIRRSQEAGFDHHFIKPVNPVALAEFLARKITSKTTSA